MTAVMQMEEDMTSPKWLKVAAAIGAVWYAFGCLQFWLGVTTDTSVAAASGAMTEAHAAAVASTPAGIWAAFALASFLGLVGSVLLLRRSPLSTLVFGVSLLCAIVYYAWVYGISGTGWDRPSEEFVIGMVVVLVTFGFFTLSRRMT